MWTLKYEKTAQKSFKKIHPEVALRLSRKLDDLQRFGPSHSRYQSGLPRQRLQLKRHNLQRCQRWIGHVGNPGASIASLKQSV